MAINPNTDFTAGQVLTAAEQNRFPRGIVAQASSTTSDTNITSTETVQLTSTTFTAVANRYYKITYYEPQALPSAGVPNYIYIQIRKTNTAGTLYARGMNTAETNTNPAVGDSITVTTIQTFTAGSTVIVATALVNGGTGSCIRQTGQPALLLVEDIGPA
jgi:hypothetical protein